jgi:hypothetical protein
MVFLTSLPLAPLAVFGVHGTDSSGLRGVRDLLDDEFLTAAVHSSARTPLVQNVVGNSGGFGSVDWPFQNFQSKPGFSKMSFELSSGDINLNRLAVVPNYDRGAVAFFDKNQGEAYRFSLTGVELPADTVTDNVRRNGVQGCFDSPVQREVPGKVPVLQSFALDFDGDNVDRNIHRIRVQVDTETGTNAPIIRVCYEDNNVDDSYTLSVNYALVDENLVFGFDEFSKTKNGGGLDSSVVFERPPNTVAVINGFDLEFLSGDRDIQDILVELNQDGRVLVNFQDATADDSFRWKVNAAYIGAEF